MKNIDTAFRYIRSFTIIVILGCFVLSAVVLYKAFEQEEVARNRIYILASGKVLEAFAADRKDNVPVEAKDHIQMFHQYFFSLDPDEKVIQGNIAKALYLADGSARREYDNLKENGYYSGIIAGNISQQIVIDSIAVNVNKYPYYFRCNATQKIIRATSIIFRNLVTEGYLRNVTRSDNNSHGFLIERWTTLENKDIKIVNR